MVAWSESSAMASIRSTESNYPPAEPEALRLLAPQRGRIATEKVKNQQLRTSHLDASLVCEEKHTSGIVKLLLPPGQSRGISLRISRPTAELLRAWIGNNDKHKLPTDPTKSLQRSAEEITKSLAAVF